MDPGHADGSARPTAELIASVDGARDALAAVAGGARVLALRDPSCLGAVRAAVAGTAVLSVALRFDGDGPRFAEAIRGAEGADRIAVHIVPPDETRVAQAAPHLAALPAASPPVAVVEADGDLAALPLEAMRRAGFRRIALETPCGRAGGLLSHVPAPVVMRLAEDCRAHGLGISFGGGLEPPDVPRLLAARPEALRFGAALRRNGRIDSALVREIARLMTPPQGRPAGGPTDRIFVRDMVVELEIGAYGRERGKRQKVRFTVEVDIRRARDAVAGMGDVYSYDLITDAIGTLAAGAHVDFVETLAEDLAARVLADPRVAGVFVRVEKLELGPAAVGIEIRRG